MGVGGQRHALGALPLGKTRYPLYRTGLDGSGFDPWTVHPVTSRCTDYAIPAY
jgi:hypothetical protein